MIQNERQYKITHSKLRGLQIDRATLDLPTDLHPRQVLARQNSLGILIGELEREIAEYVGEAALLRRQTLCGPESLALGITKQVIGSKAVELLSFRSRKRARGNRVPARSPARGDLRQNCGGVDSEGTSRKNWRSREIDLTIEERVILASADRQLMMNTSKIYKELSQFIDLPQYRLDRGGSPQKWWWYLDVLNYLPSAFNLSLAVFNGTARFGKCVNGCADRARLSYPNRHLAITYFAVRLANEVGNRQNIIDIDLSQYFYQLL